MADVSREKKQGGKGAKVAIIAGIAVIIILLVVVIVLLLRRGDEQEEVKRNVVVTQENAEQVIEDMVAQEYVAPGYYTANMSTTWHFATGDAISEDAYVENDASNTNDIFFDVFLRSDEETPILQSPVIPRGARLDNISLDTALEAGTYDCVMVYHLVDDEQTTVSTLRIAFTIIVEK